MNVSHEEFKQNNLKLSAGIGADGIPRAWGGPRRRLYEAFKFFFRPYLAPNHRWPDGPGVRERAKWALKQARAEQRAHALGIQFVWEGDELGRDTLVDYHDPTSGTCPVEELRRRYASADEATREEIRKAYGYGRNHTYRRVGGWCDHEVEVLVAYEEDDESRDHPLASVGGIIDAGNSRREYEADLAIEALAELDRREAVKRSDVELRKQARELYAEEGQIEIEDNAEVSRAEGECGAYVQAWVYVPLDNEE